jgi:tRNA-specific 2-thiouridylase
VLFIKKQPVKPKKQNKAPDPKSPKKVALGMSGGVDSSVSAYLLQKQGYEVTGVFMQCWDERADGCKADEDRAFAAKTAAQLGLKFEVLDFRQEYKSKVMSYFYAEYLLGRTPNPDVMCNKEIKFGLFYEWALENDFDFVATGHYARSVSNKHKKFELHMGLDASKDQSYFLYLLDQNRLARTLFPVGELTKTNIRKLAKSLQLPSAERPDSMGICFIGEVDIKDFLKKQIEPKVGEVVDLEGEIIGIHDGIWYYTIGQRHGFKLSKYFGHPMYVVSKDVAKNRLIVGEEKAVLKSEFEVENIHWINKGPLTPDNYVKCEVRIRHLGELVKATITKREKLIQVYLEKPIFGVAPGQSAVFYQGSTVLGGGVISARKEES